MLKITARQLYHRGLVTVKCKAGFQVGYTVLLGHFNTSWSVEAVCVCHGTVGAYECLNGLDIFGVWVECFIVWLHLLGFLSTDYSPIIALVWLCVNTL